MKHLIPPLLLIVAGIAWLMNVLELFPRVDWIWTAGLASAGIATLALAGTNRLTAVVGPFLLTASGFSIVRQTGLITFRREIPLLTIAAGVFWLISSLLKLPVPEALRPAETARE